jgi:hypothetical protein
MFSTMHGPYNMSRFVTDYGPVVKTDYRMNELINITEIPVARFAITSEIF